MSSFSKVFNRELRKIRSNWSLLFMTIVGPLLGFLIMIYIFSPGVPRKLPVAVVDHDHSSLSRKIAQYVDVCPIADIDKNYVSLLEAKKDMENGAIEAVVYIPEKTEANVYKGRSADIILYINNENVLKGGLLTSGIRRALSTLSTGIKLQTLMKTGLNQNAALNKALPVQVKQVILFNPYTNYTYYLTTALLVLILILFTLTGTVYSLGNELYRGTGPGWMKCSGNSIVVGLTGKLLPYTILYFIVAQVMNFILFGIIKMPLHGNLHLIIIGELLMIISYQFLAVFLVGFTTNLRLSIALSSAYVMLALTYCGLTFPYIGMPAFSKAFSMVFPYTWFIKILVGQSLRGEPAMNVLPQFYILAGFLLLGISMMPRLKYMLHNEKRWGKM